MVAVERLEALTLLSGAFDVTGLTALRNDSTYRDVDGSGVGIAVIDTGIFASHPDLQANVVDYFDAVRLQGGGVSAAIDPAGHGTHVAGTAASSNPRIGVAPRARIVAIRGLPGDGEARPRHDTVAAGLQWVIDNHQAQNIRVVNMSLGVTANINQEIPRDREYGPLIGRLESLGITVVTSSGNSYANYAAPGASYPAVHSTLSVASTWEDDGVGDRFVLSYGVRPGERFGAREFNGRTDRLAAMSQRSTLSNQVASPGQTILSTWNGDKGLLYNTISGTSMAAPLVSGMVALMQDAAQTFGGRFLRPDEIVSIVRTTADTIVDANDPNSSRYDVTTGQTVDLPETGLSFQRVNIYRAVQQVRALVSRGATPPPGGGVASPDTNSTRTSAIVVPMLDGNRVYDFAGTIGSDGAVQIGPNDVDLYRLELTSPSEILAAVVASNASSLDGLLRVFDSAGNEIAFNDDFQSGSLNPAVVTAPAPPGVYYVGVSSASNRSYSIASGSGASNGRSQGDFSLRVLVRNPDPNGVFTGAVAHRKPPSQFQGIIGSDPPPANSSERIEIGPDDVDMFEVIAPDDGRLVVDVNAEAIFGASAVDSLIRVFDDSGNEIARNDDADGSIDAFLRVDALKGRRLFVAISSFWNDAYSPSDPYGRIENGSGGLYELNLGFENGDVNGTVYESVPIQIGQSLPGIIGRDFGGPIIGRDGSLDVDFLSLSPTQSGLLEISARGVSGFRPVLTLWTFNAETNTIDRLVESGDDASVLIAEVTSGSTYYISINGDGNRDFDWFAPATGTGGATGEYTIETRLRSRSDLSVLSDDALSNSSAVRDVSVGDRVSDRIGLDGGLFTGADDVDLFRFVATTSGAFLARTTTTHEESADTFLRVFNAGGQEIGFNDDASAETTGSSVRFVAVAGLSYFIGVNGASAGARGYDPIAGGGGSAGSTGQYVLSVDPFSTARITVETGTLSVDERAGQAIVTVVRSGNTEIPASASFRTAAGTATSGADFTSISGIVSFEAGETRKTISIALLDDPAVEPVENFRVEIDSPSIDAELVGNLSATIQIQNDDLPPPVRLSSIEAVRSRRGLTGLNLIVNAPIRPLGSSSLGLFRLVRAGRDNRFGTRDDRQVRLRSVSVDGTSRRTVNLTLGETVPARTRLRLTAIGDGLLDESGLGLDLDGDGRAGGGLAFEFRS